MVGPGSRQRERAAVGCVAPAVEHRVASGFRGHPNRSLLECAESGNPAVVRAKRECQSRCPVGRSQEGRKSSAGQDAQEANAGSRKATGNPRQLLIGSLLLIVAG